MNATLSAAQWLQIAGLGAVFGILGQLIRAIAGIKKFHETNAAADEKETLSSQRLVTSLAIGAVAGALAALATGSGLDLEKIQSSVILGLMGAGYAGADFIEAFMQKYVGGPTKSAASGTNAPQQELGNDSADSATSSNSADDANKGNSEKAYG